jgi:anti-sigma regulatory factor (Ser/Thr protein kinase)
MPRPASTAVRVLLPAAPLSVRQARRYVRAYLGFAPAVAQQAELALSEAIANAVIHAYGGGDGEIELSMSLRDGRVEIVVRDNGIGRTAYPENDGFGMVLMRSLSERLEICGSPGTGTTVRMAFPLADAA